MSIIIWASEAYLLQTCCKGDAKSPIDDRCDIPNLKSLAQVYVLECGRAAAEMLHTCCCPTAEELQNCLEMLHTKFEVSRSSICFKVLQVSCRSAAALLKRSCRIAYRSSIWSLKSLGKVYALDCCRTEVTRSRGTFYSAADLLQNCRRLAAD